MAAKIYLAYGCGSLDKIRIRRSPLAYQSLGNDGEILMPRAGLEPACGCPRWILSPEPPSPHPRTKRQNGPESRLFSRRTGWTVIRIDRMNPSKQPLNSHSRQDGRPHCSLAPSDGRRVRQASRQHPQDRIYFGRSGTSRLPTEICTASLF
jgi:hypothetical protein